MNLLKNLWYKIFAPPCLVCMIHPHCHCVRCGKSWCEEHHEAAAHSTTKIVLWEEVITCYHTEVVSTDGTPHMRFLIE